LAGPTWVRPRFFSQTDDSPRFGRAHTKADVPRRLYIYYRRKTTTNPRRTTDKHPHHSHDINPGPTSSTICRDRTSVRRHAETRRHRIYKDYLRRHRLHSSRTRLPTQLGGKGEVNLESRRSSPGGVPAPASTAKSTHSPTLPSWNRPRAPCPYPGRSRSRSKTDKPRKPWLGKQLPTQSQRQHACRIHQAPSLWTSSLQRLSVINQ
jgi:hypothetical protein